MQKRYFLLFVLFFSIFLLFFYFLFNQYKGIFLKKNILVKEKSGFSIYYRDIIDSLFLESGSGTDVKSSKQLVQKLENLSKDTNLTEKDRMYLRILHDTINVLTIVDLNSSERKSLQEKAMTTYKSTIDSINPEGEISDKVLFSMAVSGIISTYRTSCSDSSLLKKYIPKQYEATYTNLLAKGDSEKKIMSLIRINMLDDAIKYQPLDARLVSLRLQYYPIYLLNYKDTISDSERTLLVSTLQNDFASISKLDYKSNVTSRLAPSLAYGSALSFDVINSLFASTKVTPQIDDLINKGYEGAIKVADEGKDEGLGSILSKNARIAYATSLYRRGGYEQNKNKIDELLKPIYNETGSNESNLAISYCYGKAPAYNESYFKKTLLEIAKYNKNLDTYLKKISQ